MEMWAQINAIEINGTHFDMGVVRQGLLDVNPAVCGILVIQCRIRRSIFGRSNGNANYANISDWLGYGAFHIVWLLPAGRGK